MLVANIKIGKSHLNIREGSDYSLANRGSTEESLSESVKISWK